MRPAPNTALNVRPTSPRAYAQLILAASCKTARDICRAQIPPLWRDLVQTHVANALAHRQQSGHGRTTIRKPYAVAPPVIGNYRAPTYTTGNSAVAAHYLDAARAALTSQRAEQ